MNTFEVKEYKGQVLPSCLVSYKIDGVQGRYDGVYWTSRENKPLFNLPKTSVGIYEIYLGDWNKSVSACRTQIGGTPIETKDLYRLDVLDNRLIQSFNLFINQQIADDLLRRAVSIGYEGLVFVYEGVRYKHKPIKTFDEKVIGWLPGKGKHTGRMGALLTAKGKVGTGFTDYEREQFTPAFIIGKTIEVACLDLTQDGFFRHPRFVRLRLDK